MARRVFFSFHFDHDFWRTQQVRNMGALEGQPLCTPNVWEEVKRKGKPAIEKWIADNMHGKSCAVVLVGSQTAIRPWVIHEIIKAWDDRKGVLGIRVDRLLDRTGQTSVAGANPFDSITIDGTSRKLSSVVPLITPGGSDSKAVYASISNGIENGTSRKLSSVVPLITPRGSDSKAVYASISNGIEKWIEDAIAIRGRN